MHWAGRRLARFPAIGFSSIRPASLHSLAYALHCQRFAGTLADTCEASVYVNEPLEKYRLELSEIEAIVKYGPQS